MNLTIETKHNIGDPVYFINEDGEISRGFVTKIDIKATVYESTYTGKHEDYKYAEYHVSCSQPGDHVYCEEKLFSNPHEIIAVLNDQIEREEYS